MGAIAFAPLSTREKLFIWRKREGLSQNDAAKHFGVSRNEYTSWERMEEAMMRIPLTVSRVQTKTLTPQERCVVHRRRAGMNQREVADALGLCRYTINLKETGKLPVDDLIAYWEG